MPRPATSPLQPPLSAGFNNTERLLTDTNTNAAAATWTFYESSTTTDPYYNVYVTWNPQSGAATQPSWSLTVPRKSIPSAAAPSPR